MTNDSVVFWAKDGTAVERDRLACVIRDYLAVAGIKRAELHNDGPNRGRFGTHDFRRSFVTRSLANGRSDDWVRSRTGHRSAELLNYRQAARALVELQLGELLPLIDAIPELRKLAQGGPRRVDPERYLVECRNDSTTVREKGVEPSRLASPEPKSGASANSATRARAATIVSAFQ